MALRVQLVIWRALSWRAVHFGEFLVCPTLPEAYVSSYLEKWGTPSCPVVQDPLSGARPLGDGVGSADLRDGNTSVWSRGTSLVWSLVLPAPVPSYF